jgi:hypothetical protein
MRKGTSRDVSSLYQAEAARDLRSMGRAGKTAAQERMEASFGAKREGRKKPGASRSGGLARRRSGRW